MKHTFEVPGKPKPAQRMTQKSKWNKRSRESLDYQNFVGWCAKAIPTFNCPVKLTCRFYFKNKVHGDLSNLVKSCEDALQYVGKIPNDKLVLAYGEGTGIFYGDEEKAVITVEKLQGVE